MFSAVGIPYAFSWSVKDPTGASTSATSNVLSTTSSWSISTGYPSSFSGASSNLVGTYKINLSETLPTSTSNVVNGSFLVGITDFGLYQRTSLVQIQSGGFLPSDAVNVTITRNSDLATVFTTPKTSDSNGLVTAIWQTMPSTSKGNYTAKIMGKNTPAKSVPDIQQFIVYPTNITTTGLRVGSTGLERSEIQSFRFNATYLNGQTFTQGSNTIRLTEPDGLTTHVVLATYGVTTGGFTGSFVLPLASQIGSWKATLDPLSLGDSYGNAGPLQPSSVQFSVLAASLTVSLVPSSQILGASDVLAIQTAVITPGGTNFTQGTVQASFTLLGRNIGSPVTLAYDPTRGQWTGSYRIAPSDPSGTWLITVSASDSYGNSGQNSVTATIAVPGPQSSSSMIWTIVLIVLLVVGLGFTILITRKKGFTRREVKLDIQAIKTQADKVKDDDFLRSLHAQLQRKKQEVGLEKKDHD